VWEYVNGFLGMFRFANMKRLETGVYRCYRLPPEALPDFSGDFHLEKESWEATLLRHPVMA